ncbi:MAG: hypothetical protein WD770_01725 [Actinomycetota bacterium]
MRESELTARRTRARARRAARGVALVAGLTTVGVGGWAFFGPASFADFAQFPPYNEHLFHDIGAFLIGLGSTLLLALVWLDGLFVALAGNAIAGVAHFVSHLIDRDLGGRGTDPITFGFLAVVVGLAALVRYRDVER